MRVSIPQSGFGAFEPAPGNFPAAARWQFQSLSRDSGRLNCQRADICHQPAARFNPSVGIRGV